MKKVVPNTTIKELVDRQLLNRNMTLNPIFIIKPKGKPSKDFKKINRIIKKLNLNKED